MTEAAPAAGEITVGTVLRWPRRYRPADLAAFLSLSGGSADPADLTHLPDLLVIAPLTKLGGDLNYVSRQMTWTVHRRVRSDELIEAELEVTALEERGGTLRIAFDARIRDEAGEVVVSGDSRGLLLRPDAPAAG